MRSTTRPLAVALARRLAAVLAAVALGGLSGLTGCGDREPADDSLVLRVGHFPNVTHAHGVIGHHRSRGGLGFFEERIGKGASIEWYVFDAGPIAMETLLAGDLDLAYVGPSPALNAHFKSKGENVRIVSGATRGGAGLVVRKGSGLKAPGDFRGKTIATPQPGNTQDVSARAWLARGGLRITQTGGDARVIPTSNATLLEAFQGGEFDAAWTVEPWLSRLELNADAELLVEEKDSITTVLVASARALEHRRPLVAKFVAAHRALTEWIAAHPDEARTEVRDEILLETKTKTKLTDAVFARCWPRLSMRDDVAGTELEAFVESAKAAGFAKDAIPLARLVEKP